MRSRYAAYASKNYQYVVDTYAEDKRLNITVNDIAADSEQIFWLLLTVHNHKLLNDNQGIVEFSAFYLIKDQLFELREKSRFLREKGLWRYFDGDILLNSKINKLKRNDLCPCHSGKKFKHCCQLKAQFNRIP